MNQYTKPLLVTSFYDYDSNPEIYLILQGFYSAVESKSDLTSLKGDLFLKEYHQSELIDQWEFSQVKMKDACWGELDHSSCNPMIIEITWEYGNFKPKENI